MRISTFVSMDWFFDEDKRAGFESIDRYGVSRIEGSHDPDRDPCRFIGNNSGHCAYDLLVVGGVTALPTIFNPMPLNFVDELIEEGYYPLTWNPND